MRIWFNSLEIRAKLMIGYLILCLVILGVGIMGLNGSQTMSTCVHELYYDSMAEISNIKDIKEKCPICAFPDAKNVSQFRNNRAALEKDLSEVSQVLSADGNEVLSKNRI